MCLQDNTSMLCFVYGLVHSDVHKIPHHSGSCLQGWMDNPLHVRVGAAGRIPAGLRHCFIAAEPHQKMAILCRQIRRDLEQ